MPDFNSNDDEDLDVEGDEQVSDEDEIDDIYDLYGHENPEDSEEAAYDDVLKIMENGD